MWPLSVLVLIRCAMNRVFKWHAISVYYIHIQGVKKIVSGLQDMITYIKTKKIVPVKVCPISIGLPCVCLFVFLPFILITT